jgi:hypothetical protein
MSGGQKGIDKQMRCIKDRAEFRAAIDRLGDDGLAILVTRTKAEGDNQLRILSFGEGQETEFLGLLGYASVVMHREYFTDGD